MVENNDKFDIERLVAFWSTEADEALEVADHLVEKGDYSIEARYPDVKRAFREKCAAEYTEKELARIDELFRWPRSHVP
jgi:hypothetical protein